MAFKSLQDIPTWKDFENIIQDCPGTQNACLVFFSKYINLFNSINWIINFSVVFQGNLSSWIIFL